MIDFLFNKYILESITLEYFLTIEHVSEKSTYEIKLTKLNKILYILELLSKIK